MRSPNSITTSNHHEHHWTSMKPYGSSENRYWVRWSNDWIMSSCGSLGNRIFLGHGSYVFFCFFVQTSLNVWLVLWNMLNIFHFIYGVILSIDFHIFQDGYCTTNQMYFVCLYRLKTMRPTNLVPHGSVPSPRYMSPWPCFLSHLLLQRGETIEKKIGNQMGKKNMQKNGSLDCEENRKEH